MHEAIIEKTNPVAIIYNHKKDIQLSIQLNRWMLELIGAWPKSIVISWIEKYAYALLNVICTGLISFLIVPAIIYIVLEMDDAYLILKLSGALSFCALAIVKYFLLIFHKKDIRSGIEYIENDWINTQHYDDRIIMISSAKFGRRLVMICAFFMYGGAVFFYLALPFSVGKITEADENLTYRPLVYPVARVIVDARHSPVNEIFFWIQCLSGFIAHSITASGCSLAAVFAMHAYGRMETLMQWIEHLVDGREDLCDNINERLAMIVEQHIRILRFISLTDKILREISIVEIVQCTVSMCLLGYNVIMVCIFYKKYVLRKARSLVAQNIGNALVYIGQIFGQYESMYCQYSVLLGLFQSNIRDQHVVYNDTYNVFSHIRIFTLQEWESKKTASYITYIVLLLSFTFNIFIFCYIGELVAEKWKKISEVSYMIDWYRLLGRKSLDLILLMTMSNTSIKLTAGNFFELSLSTFGDVVKTSVAYFNMLRTLNI